MNKFLLLISAYLLFVTAGWSQVYIDQFDNDDPGFMEGAATFSFGERDGELTISADGSGGPWDVFSYDLNDGIMAITVDATGNNKVFVRAKASSVGTSLRMDIEDAGGFATTNAGLTKVLTTDFAELEYDFTGVYQDGGFGGTACMSGPCPVDGTQSARLVFYVDPGAGGFSGDIVIDYIAFGEEPSGVVMSDVFQDLFDDPISVNSFGTDFSAA